MKKEITQRLISLNREFYESFGKAFSATRRRIQPGVRRIFEALPEEGDWLDIGCGNGALAYVWGSDPQRAGSYLGTDFSQALLDEAREYVSEVKNPQLDIRFLQADLANEDWSAELREQRFDGILSFAVFHHIPNADLRLRIFKTIHQLLKPGTKFYHSEWQYQHSPRLLARQISWDAANIDEKELEEGDTLLDWRYALPGQIEQRGLRYVHIYSSDELRGLADQSGFEVINEFSSDGKEGNLGLYQVWQKK